jgi:hypothetical protein
MPVIMDPPMTTRDVAVTAAEVLPGAGAPTAVQAMPPAMAQPTEDGLDLRASVAVRVDRQRGVKGRLSRRSTRSGARTNGLDRGPARSNDSDIQPNERPPWPVGCSALAPPLPEEKRRSAVKAWPGCPAPAGAAYRGCAV